MNGSFPFLTTDLTHATCELQSSSAHHSLWLSGRASYSICRIPFYNRTFFLLSINSKTVNGHICTLSLPQRVFVFYLHSLVRVHCINLQPLVTKPLAKLRTPVLNRVRKKKCKEKYWNRWLIRLVMRAAKKYLLGEFGLKRHSWNYAWASYVLQSSQFSPNFSIGKFFASQNR